MMPRGPTSIAVDIKKKLLDLNSMLHNEITGRGCLTHYRGTAGAIERGKANTKRQKV